MSTAGRITLSPHSTHNLSTMTASTLATYNTSNLSLARVTTKVSSKVIGLNHGETMLMITLLALLVVLILFGNSLVLGIFYQYTPLRTVTNYFIVSLAVADILVAVFSIPIWIAYIHAGLVEDKFGALLYRFWIFLDITSGVASVMNLTLVSVDRYIYIVLPYKYRNLVTKTRGKVVICIIWLYAACLALVKGIAFEWARPNYEILIFILAFLLPSLIMGFSYFKIFSTARKQRSKAVRSSNIRNREFKAAKTIAVVILAFFTCWCPFFLLNLLYGIYPSWTVPGGLVTGMKYFHYANSALNPVIYACCNQEYRSAFRALLARRRLLYDVYRSNNKKNLSMESHMSLRKRSSDTSNSHVCMPLKESQNSSNV